MEKLGVLVVGVNGAVSSTVIAGVELMKKGHAPRVGMLTERTEAKGQPELSEMLDIAPLESIVFGGWDPQFANAFEASLNHKVFHPSTLAAIKDELSMVKPWPAVFHKDYAVNVQAKNVTIAKSHRDEIDILTKNIEAFKKEHGTTRIVIVNLASTERYLEVSGVHENIEAFEAGLDANDKAISPAMRYFYTSCKLGIPYCNFAPSLTNVPALIALAHKTGTPYAGMDGKTGQTLVKTALASMFRARRIQVEGWYSTNFLGNNDGLVLNDPGSNKTKIVSKQSVLDSILGYKVENHQVHIHYYKPRGDAKEAWDNIDLIGWGGIPMQMKINFLCQDSVLAAPLVMDMVRILDVAKRKGEKGIQRQLSLYFKSPYHEAGETPTHDFFEQERMLFDWAKKHSK